VRGIDHEDHSNFRLAPAGAFPSRLAARLPDFFMLMKPRVMVLAVFTALVGVGHCTRSSRPLLGSIAVLAIAAEPAPPASSKHVVRRRHRRSDDSHGQASQIPRGTISRGSLHSELFWPAAQSTGSCLALNVKQQHCSPSRSFFLCRVYTVWLKATNASRTS